MEQIRSPNRGRERSRSMTRILRLEGTSASLRRLPVALVTLRFEPCIIALMRAKRQKYAM